MDIKRDEYLQRLVDRMNNGMVKVVTGLRRVGKSYLLLTIFVRYLKGTGVDDAHIIRLDMDNPENQEFKDPVRLLHYLLSQVTDTNMHYILLDEIQMVRNFEGVLNTLLRYDNIDVYVTGSNSRLLSKDIITEFRGRGDEIHLFPLSFSEFMSVYPGTAYEGWKEYAAFGGLPQLFRFRTNEQKVHYLETLFKETYLKDILERRRINDTLTLDILMNILSSSVGSLTNPYRISNTFSSEHHDQISPHTIKTYIEALEDSFLIAEAQRYDIRGREYITTPLKYYFEDVGLRNARLNFRQYESPHIMENILFNELRSRGYSVDVGIVEVFSTNKNGVRVRKCLEVDFIVNKGYDRYYIQSAFTLEGEGKREQETASLISIPDSFPRIIITGDNQMMHRDENGFLIVNVLDFLLDKSILP